MLAHGLLAPLAALHRRVLRLDLWPFGWRGLRVTIDVRRLLEPGTLRRKIGDAARGFLLHGETPCAMERAGRSESMKGTGIREQGTQALFLPVPSSLFPLLPVRDPDSRVVIPRPVSAVRRPDQFLAIGAELRKAVEFRIERHLLHPRPIELDQVEIEVPRPRILVVRREDDLRTV